MSVDYWDKVPNSFFCFKILFRADQLAAHQMYGQTGSSGEPQIDQNMHSRNYYTTR